MSQNSWGGWRSQARVVKVPRAALPRTLTTIEALRTLVVNTSKVHTGIMWFKVFTTKSGSTMVVGEVDITKLVIRLEKPITNINVNLVK